MRMTPKLKLKLKPIRGEVSGGTIGATRDVSDRDSDLGIGKMSKSQKVSKSEIFIRLSYLSIWHKVPIIFFNWEDCIRTKIKNENF